MAEQTQNIQHQNLGGLEISESQVVVNRDFGNSKYEGASLMTTIGKPGNPFKDGALLMDSMDSKVNHIMVKGGDETE